MASDLSRKTFRFQKHYSGVLMQQGRVQLDADWNEQLDIQQYRTHTETRDVIGESGVPKNVNGGNSFKISLPPSVKDVFIAHGRIYVGGLLCELEADCSYFMQPHYPRPNTKAFGPCMSSPLSPPASPASPASPIAPDKLCDGAYIVYLDAWQREINYLDDPRIQEVALGGPDTTTRLQTVWQVKLLPIGNLKGTCDTLFPEWKGLIKPLTGTLNVKTTAEAPKTPCVLPPQAAYRRLENQLYRVEVHSSTAAGTTFKWSRDNATVETIVEDIDGVKLTVASLGRDEDFLGFAVSQWVELVDEAATLNSNPHPLFKIKHVDSANRIIELDATSLPIAKVGGKLPFTKLRRWDQSVSSANANGLTVNTVGSWLPLEDGIEVQFSGGTYHVGDYWLIPARTATGQVEWNGGAQLPHGVPHAYCKLAILWVEKGAVTVQDCRPMFPPLTELPVCDDIRLHNKYLHGYGVICGLKVKCGISSQNVANENLRYTNLSANLKIVERQYVTIEKGNALDCEGYMIQVKEEIPYNIVEEAIKRKYVDAKQNGMVCLSIARGANKSSVIDMEQFTPQPFWNRVLEGTLIKDFYDECIKNLIDFFKAHFPIPLNGNETVPVTREQRRLTTAYNLLMQLGNKTSGPFAFLSGKSPKIEKLGDGSDEDDLLREFYNDLRALLTSETFCAMFDGDRPFPAYNVHPGLDTIFGPPLKLHRRLRTHPKGTFAYTCGNNNKVYVYSLEGTQELIEVSTFPVIGATIPIQDILVDPSGSLLYAVAVENNNSWFATAKILSSGKLAWGNASQVLGFKYVSLGLAPQNRLFAVAKARGLHQISGIGTSNITNTVFQSFNATGLLHINTSNNPLANELVIAVVAANNGVGVGVETPNFDHLRVINLNASAQQLPSIGIAGEDAKHDILMYKNIIYASGDSHSQRILSAFNVNGSRISTISIDDTSHIRMDAYSETLVTGGQTDYLLLTLSDKYKVVRVELKTFRLDTRFRIPTQISPIDIIVVGQKAFVLNALVNTITTIDLRRSFQILRPNYVNEPPFVLYDYRKAVIDAYTDVLSHFIQSLKDCFCDKFLIDCPECDDDDKVYLGCVEIRGGKVHHICNFSKRKYVKTFRTVEYWLSTVPIMPIVREAFTKFCCTVLETPQNKASNNINK